jgi:hypothetical protein
MNGKRYIFSLVTVVAVVAAATMSIIGMVHVVTAQSDRYCAVYVDPPQQGGQLHQFCGTQQECQDFQQIAVSFGLRVSQCHPFNR